MSLSTTETVRETYRLALQQEVSRGLRTKHDWDRFLATAKEGRDRLDAETTDYRENYVQRLVEARAAVLRERTGVHYDHPRPTGAPDPFDKESVETQAKARVLRDHQQRVACIVEDEIDGYRDLRSELQSRARKQGLARDSFNMAGRAPSRAGPTRSQ